MAFPVLGVLLSLVGKFSVAFLAFRLFLITLVCVALPIVLNNLMFGFIEKSLSFITANSGEFQPLVLQLTGVGAYLAAELGLVDCFNITMGFVAAKFALSMIPFSPIK